MENILQKELEREESELISNVNQSSWKRFIGLQRSTIEEKYRQQCVKELDRVFMSRRQLDQSMKKNQAVGIFTVEIVEFGDVSFSFVRLLIKMN
jgi:hypothetical protein